MQHVQGSRNLEDYNEKYLHIVGNAKDEEDRSNAHTLDWNGVGWFQGGLKVGGTGQDDEAAVDVLTTKDRVQPDWNQNDESQPDYVRNRTHWRERPYEPIVWDGSTEGRDSVDLSSPQGLPEGSIVLHKIAEYIPPETLVGSKVCASTANETAYTEIDDYITLVDGALYHMNYYTLHDDENEIPVDWASGQLVLSAISGDYSDSLGIVIPSAGIYAMQTSVVPHDLSISKNIYHQIDEEYLPSTIATKEYVDNLITGAIGGSY